MAVGMEAVAAFVAPPDVQEVPDLTISVIHGSLECAGHPVLVGHATGTPIAGAEARCDAMLGGELSELHVLGNYPHQRGTFLYVPKTRPEHRIEGCVVVALDSTAPLSTGELAEQVCRAVVDFAERRRWERLIRDGDRADAELERGLGLSTVPLGSGPALTLGLERSVDAVVGGVQRANAILRSARPPDDPPPRVRRALRGPGRADHVEPAAPAGAGERLDGAHRAHRPGEPPDRAGRRRARGHAAAELRERPMGAAVDRRGRGGRAGATRSAG